MSDSPESFLAALAPVVSALGGELILEGDAQPGDEPVEWRGEVVAHVRPGDYHDALERAVATVERDLGNRLADMDRAQKQSAVRQLDELGAFLFRGAVEQVAGWMGVSRVTLYSYLNAIERAGD